MVSVCTANCTIENFSILPARYVCFVHLSQRTSIISVISIKELDFCNWHGLCSLWGGNWINVYI